MEFVRMWQSLRLDAFPGQCPLHQEPPIQTFYISCNLNEITIINNHLFKQLIGGYTATHCINMATTTCSGKGASKVPCQYHSVTLYVIYEVFFLSLEVRSYIFLQFICAVEVHRNKGHGLQCKLAGHYGDRTLVTIH